MQSLNLKGQQYRDLYILELDNNSLKYKAWLCQCSCGRVISVFQSNLRSGTTKSCGCTTKNKGSNTPLYAVWSAMKQRTLNKKHKYYAEYGGRGITLFHLWKDFLQFKEWAISAGYNDLLEIDRIDNNLGYSPENCRWVTRNINERNKRKISGTSSKYYGVYWHKKRKKWSSHITVDNHKTWLGYFNTEIDAALARDAYIHKHKLSGFPLNSFEQNPY